MRFLLRMTFWLGVILVLLPRGEATPTSNAQLSAVEAVSAATATVGDMRQFCERQPDACIVGSQAAVALGDRAKAGAKALYDMFNDRLTASESDAVTTATASQNGKPIPLPLPRPSPHGPQTASQHASQNASPPQNTSQHTLTPSDLTPAWRGPTSRKDPHARPA
jgi:hypothetical protein